MATLVNKTVITVIVMTAHTAQWRRESAHKTVITVIVMTAHTILSLKGLKSTT